uniref:Taste receptor, type 1, member 2, tandem duplicate 1 n=1 Tax=Gadus morhua TaxID=8049 RepID=A0A8C4ZLL9_GADMO
IKSLTNRSEIERIGTIVGVSEKTANLSGFEDFINSKNHSKPHNVTGDFVCEQDCNCDDITGKDILAEEASYNFQVYTATYAIAQALHNVLECDRGKCKVNGTVYPYMVPESVCSPECDVGYAKTPEGIHRCCFTCEKCKNGTYLNITADAYRCQECSISEWSLAGSTSCQLRSVEYIPYSDPMAILIIVGAMILAALSLAIAVLFLVHHNTPVVKSAGGLMCFIILVSLALCTISIFFYFEKPSTASCILRYLPFILFYTACLACFWVHAFQIVCAFKMAANLECFLYALFIGPRNTVLFVYRGCESIG